MNTYIIRGAFVRILCMVCRGNGSLVRPQELETCPVCRGDGMLKP